MLALVTDVITPLVVIRPIRWLSWLVNHRAPSGPAVIPIGLRMFGFVNVVTLPAVVIRPIRLLL